MQLATLRAKYGSLVPVFTERSRRVWAATEAQAIGYGGIALVARATGMAESTIQRGLRDLLARRPSTPTRWIENLRNPQCVNAAFLHPDAANNNCCPPALFGCTESPFS